MQEKDQPSVFENSDWTASNVSASPATLHVQTFTDIQFPQVRVVPATAVALVSLVLVYLGLRLLSPKVAAIALTTGKEAMSQPLFYVVLALGVFSLLAFIFVPYNTFGEDIKMLKDSGLTLIMVLAHDRGRVVGQRVDLRGSRGPHRADRALQAGQAPAVHPRQVSGRARPGGGAVHRAGIPVPAHRFVTRSCTTPAKWPRASRPGSFATWK